MKEEKFCQSCGMPMGETDEFYGKEADGTKSADYCSYCYNDGKFAADVTMEQMMEYCIPHIVEYNKDMTEEDARKMLKEFYPHLKRWKKCDCGCGH